MASATTPGQPHARHRAGTYAVRPNGRVQAQVYLNGHRFTKTHRNKREASAWVAGLVTEAEKGTLAAEAHLTTLAAFLEDWQKSTQQARAKTTANRYAWACKHLIEAFGKTKLSALRPDRIQAYYAQAMEAGLSPASVAAIHSTLHSALADALRWGLVARNVADAVRSPKDDPAEVEPWTVEQARQFLAGVEDDPLCSFWFTALYTGLRVSELCGLHWNDVNLETGRIAVVRQLHRIQGQGMVEEDLKSKSSQRAVVVPPSVRAQLKRWKAHQNEQRLSMGEHWPAGDHVFTNPRGHTLEQSYVWERFLALAHSLAVPAMKFHGLRHTAASLALEAGATMQQVQAMLGHSTLNQTMGTYAHLYRGSQEIVADKLDKVLRPK